MRPDLSDSQKRIHDSLFELYMIGGLELLQAGTRGLKRELIIDLETSALTPERGEVIRYRAINRWDEDDFFDEWARPSMPLSPEAEMIVGTTNEGLEGCRPTMVVMDDFLRFVGRRDRTRLDGLGEAGALFVIQDKSAPKAFSADYGRPPISSALNSRY